VALIPPETPEAETLPRNLLVKNQRVSVAVASFASWGRARTFLEAQTKPFSSINIIIACFSFYTVISFITSFSVPSLVVSLAGLFPLQEKTLGR
jgi:hypothetical protein